MSDIFREIDEELRRENFQQLWKRYHNYVLVLAVLVVVATAGFVGWRQYRQSQREAEGVRFAAALDLVHQGKDAQAADAFADLGQHAAGGRAALAMFEEAAAKARTGDDLGAIALYEKISADGSADPLFRDLATLLAARYALEKGDAQNAVARLLPLTNAANPWHPLAMEMTALADMRDGETAKARDAFQALAKDNAASEDERQRASEMAEAIAP